MKYAVITSKNDITKIPEVEGKAILLNCIDKQHDRGFYEIKFIDDPKGITHCRWVDNNKIEEDI